MEWHVEKRRPNSTANVVHILDGKEVALFTVWAKRNPPDCEESHDQDEVYQRAQLAADFLDGKPTPQYKPTEKYYLEERKPDSSKNAIHIMDEAGEDMFTVWARPIPPISDQFHNFDTDEMCERARRLIGFLNGDTTPNATPAPERPRQAFCGNNRGQAAVWRC